MVAGSLIFNFRFIFEKSCFGPSMTDVLGQKLGDKRPWDGAEVRIGQ